MTQRRIVTGKNPTVIIKTGSSVSVRGTEDEQVLAESADRWGMKLEKRSQAEAAPASGEVIEVQMGGSGEVQVPFGTNLKIYAGKDVHVQGISQQVDAYSGANLELQDVYCLGNASAGGRMAVDCRTLAANPVEYSAGGDMRFCVRDLASAHIRIKDLGGFWEAKIDGGERSISLKSGGDVTLVTEHAVEALPPHFILGKIEHP